MFCEQYKLSKIIPYNGDTYELYAWNSMLNIHVFLDEKCYKNLQVVKTLKEALEIADKESHNYTDIIIVHATKKYKNHHYDYYGVYGELNNYPWKNCGNSCTFCNVSGCPSRNNYDYCDD